MPTLQELNNYFEAHVHPVKFLADLNPGLTCSKCGGHVDNYDPGSTAYQAYSGHTLPAICDGCLRDVFLNVHKHGRRA
jgi:hypothetical protein